MVPGAFPKQSIILIANTLGDVFKRIGNTPDVEEAARAAKTVIAKRIDDPLSSWHYLPTSERVMATAVLTMLIVQVWLGRQVTAQMVDTLQVMLPGSGETAAELRTLAAEMRTWS